MSSFDDIAAKFLQDEIFDDSYDSRTTRTEYSPSEFVAIFNQSIDIAFGAVHIEGEITNFRISRDRWVYFDLKDEEASLKCFATVHMLPGPLEDGMLVKLVCSPRLHPLYNFSLNVQSIVPSGEGALVKAAQLLRAKLDTEGLFDQGRKRTLPYPPETIGLVASSESAAYADFTKIMQARWPKAQIILRNVQVQGDAAPLQIVDAIGEFNKQADTPDVLVVIRGGGSADDLAAFSDERVVRAVAASRVPTLVAIGHEIDESLAELAADARASTPSNAAELVVPDRMSELKLLETDTMSIVSQINGMTKLVRHQLDHYQGRFIELIQHLFDTEYRDVMQTKQLLEAYSPTRILSQGYSLIKAAGTVVRSVGQLPSGAEIDIMLKDGHRKAKIT